MGRMNEHLSWGRVEVVNGVAVVPDGYVWTVETSGLYLPKPMTWQELVGMVADLDKYMSLGFRTSEGTKRYFAHRQQLLLRGLTTADEIRREMDGREDVLLDNIFYYDALLDPLNRVLKLQGQRVEHKCLWSVNGGGWDNHFVDRMVRHGVKNVIDWCGHEHDEDNRSVRDIRHMHIFALLVLG